MKWVYDYYLKNNYNILKFTKIIILIARYDENTEELKMYKKYRLNWNMLFKN